MENANSIQTRLGSVSEIIIISAPGPSIPHQGQEEGPIRTLDRVVDDQDVVIIDDLRIGEENGQEDPQEREDDVLEEEIHELRRFIASQQVQPLQEHDNRPLEQNMAHVMDITESNSPDISRAVLGENAEDGDNQVVMEGAASAAEPAIMEELLSSPQIIPQEPSLPVQEASRPLVVLSSDPDFQTNPVVVLGKKRKLNDGEAEKESGETSNASAASIGISKQIGEDPITATECIICFDPCTSTGPHRLAALKCGHLFGHNCIRRWITKGKKQGCPSCKKSANTRDIILLFTKNLIAVDATERDAALKQASTAKIRVLELEKLNDSLKEQLSRREMLCETYQHEAEKSQQELIRAKQEIEKLKWLGICQGDSSSCRNQADTSLSGTGYVPKTHISLSNQSGTARVLDFCPSLGRLFAGVYGNTKHGILSALVLDTNYQDFIPVHDNIIRDLKVSHHEPGLIMTASQDKTLALTSSKSRQVIHAFNLGAQVWSCAFDAIDPSLVYAGTMKNELFTFDIRFPSEPVSMLALPFKKGKGIHTLYQTSITTTDSSVFLLAGCFNDVFALSKTRGDNVENPGLSNDGISSIVSGDGNSTCSGFSWDPASNLLSSTWRIKEGTRHIIGTYSDTYTEIGRINILAQQKAMSKSLLYTHPFLENEGRFQFGCNTEESGTIGIWDVNLNSSENTLESVQSWKTLCLDHLDPLMDATPCLMGKKLLLVTLTNSRLSFFEWH